MMWPEIKVAKEENRHEFLLSGPELDKRLDENEGAIHQELFSLAALNFLRLSSSQLSVVPDELYNLSSLTDLVLQGNQLTTLSNSIDRLENLKFLDISHNKINALPNSISKLKCLSTLNASANAIETLPSFEACDNLAHLNFGHNNLHIFPDVCYDALKILADINVESNEISEIPAEISVLPSLKSLIITNNKVQIVPGEIADCSKLKELMLKGNPLSDRRFAKLVEADRTIPRQVLDYVKQHCAKGGDSKGKGKGKKGGKKKESSVDVELSEVCRGFCVLNIDDSLPTIKITSAAKEVRPYAVCCIVKGVNLENTLKNFIALQTQLHDTVCGKRKWSTIATHDCSKISWPLEITADDPSNINVVPLNQSSISAKEFYKKLLQEANALRKQHKRNAVSGIHKYLSVVSEWNLWPCIKDSNGQVISLPPLTNSDLTKISQDTKDILIEVTSSTSLSKGKESMEALLLGMLDMNIVSNDDKKIINIQQVKIIEGVDGALRVLYPSRIDLQFSRNDVNVMRVS